MGYRSEVLLAVSAKAYALLTTKIAKGGPFAELFSDECTSDQRDYDNDGSKMFLWGSVKWYDSYPEVAAVEQFMSTLDENDMEEEYKFVRVGEDMDDNEGRGWGFDDIYITRSINY